MKARNPQSSCRGTARRGADLRAVGRRGFTLTETMVALGVGMIVLVFVMFLFVSGLSNFQGLGNYAELSNQSRLTLDKMSQDIRECTQIVSCQNSGPVETLSLTNAFDNTQVTYTWNSTNNVLTCDKTGQATQTYLTGCDSWTFSLYQRTPQNNWTFYTTTNLAQCKLINMSWKCSRMILGKKINTENMVTAQLVLRNKS
jgi:Tfp pilus assembly protein PilW